MKNNFSSWLVRKEGKLETTGRSYSRAINRLSEHYSDSTGVSIDVYNVNLQQLEQIKNDYESDGKFSEFGNESHGLYRAAVKALYRYRLAHPLAKPSSTVKASKKYLMKRKKAERKTFSQRIIEFFTKLFQKQQFEKASPDSFVGTKNQISKYLIPLLDEWEKEVHDKYLSDNPQCQRCKSMEFPEVVEKPPLNSKAILKVIMKSYPKKVRQSVLISDLKSKFKNQVASGDRLIVLCRTCRKKVDQSKLKRYPHKMHPIMRKGPPELRY